MSYPMNNTIDRLLHRYRLTLNLGMEEEAGVIAIQIAEELLKEHEDAHEEEDK
jgi:hypothetical protein